MALVQVYFSSFGGIGSNSKTLNKLTGDSSWLVGSFVYLDLRASDL